jgi:lipid A ethanolaminephosphotransferase
MASPVKPWRAFHPFALSLGVALFVAVAGNVAFWRAVAKIAPGDPFGGAVFLASTFAILVLALNLLLALLALPYLWKPAAALLLLVAAVCAHFMDTYGVVIDRSMVQSVFETDTREAGDLITPALLLRVLVCGVVPACLVTRARLRFAGWRRELLSRTALVGATLVLIGGTIAAQYKDFALIGRGNAELRLLINPTSPLYAAWRYWQKRPEPAVVARIAEDARRVVPAAGARPLLVVLVVGETARAANFSLGGYERETNPLLGRLPIVYFDDVSSCGTDTATSVPCMFSPFGRERYSDRKAKSHESLLDVLQRTGVSVLWRDNNSGCKSTCDRVPTLAGSELRHPSFCVGDDCFDEVLLEGLPGWIDSLSGDGFVVLHQQGSHGPAYHKRSPPAFKRFLPECCGAAVESCSREEIVNAYDNTIVYTDFVLARLIALLERESRRFDVAMLYVSDHGESLGENGLYLHGLPRLLAPETQTRVPMLAWLSDGFAADRNVDRTCLAERRHESLSHDHVFHSMLGLFDVRSEVYAQDLDLFAPCRSLAPRLLSEHHSASAGS